MELGKLVLRATIGGLFVGDGTQKLFGWFDGVSHPAILTGRRSRRPAGRVPESPQGDSLRRAA